MTEYFKTIQVEIKRAEAVLRHIGKSAESDMASDAVNHVAFYARKQVRAHLASIFDRPKPETVNSAFVLPIATPAHPEARLIINDGTLGKRGASPARWLAAQEQGGPREFKPVEKRLTANSVLRDRYIIPARTARLDKWGGISSGQFVQMLVDLRATGNQGFNMNRQTGRNTKTTRASFYFIKRGGANAETPVIFLRNRGSQEAKPAMIAAKKANYKPRFKFFEVVQQSWNEKIKEAWAKSWARHVDKSIPPFMRGA